MSANQIGFKRIFQFNSFFAIFLSLIGVLWMWRKVKNSDESFKSYSFPFFPFFVALLQLKSCFLFVLQFQSYLKILYQQLRKERIRKGAGTLWNEPYAVLHSLFSFTTHYPSFPAPEKFSFFCRRFSFLIEIKYPQKTMSTSLILNLNILLQNNFPPPLFHIFSSKKDGIKWSA